MTSPIQLIPGQQYYIRRRTGNLEMGGLYAVSIGTQNELPVLAWADSILHAQTYSAATTAALLEKLSCRAGGFKSYRAQVAE